MKKTLILAIALTVAILATAGQIGHSAHPPSGTKQIHVAKQDWPSPPCPPKCSDPN